MNTASARKNGAIEPFWLRLGKITSYPLQASALTSITLYAGIRLLASLLQTISWIAWIVVSTMALAALYRFASQVLVNTAHGRMTAPEGWATDDNVGYTQLKLQIALMAMG